jgi:hypothetical protein
MTRPTFTEPCAFRISPRWFERFNFVNARTSHHSIQLIGGDVQFQGFFGDAWIPGFNVERCNYPFIAAYVRRPAQWLLCNAVSSDDFLTLLRLLTPDDDFCFVGIRDINSLPRKLNYG